MLQRRMLWQEVNKTVVVAKLQVRHQSQVNQKAVLSLPQKIAQIANN